MSEQQIDSNFVEIIKILNSNKIKYWICQGTLLGIIRDNQLIPWDHDIDIAVWADSISKENMIKIMTKNNFLLREKYLVKDDLLTFTKKGGKEVDINFYEETIDKKSNKKIAFANWHVPKNLFCKLIEALSMAKTYKGKFKYFIKLFYFLENIFYKLKIFLIKKGKFYRPAGYTQPLELLERFKDIIFNDITITVPEKSEEYLNYVYGKDWRIPKKKYDWYKDSPSTIEK